MLNSKYAVRVFTLAMALFLASDVFGAPRSQGVLLKSYGDAVYDFSEYTGKTYLSFMEDDIKPALDEKASGGYTVVGGETCAKVYELLDRKAQSKVSRAGKSIANVTKICDKLEGKKVTLDTLPTEIAKVDRSVDRYNLSTFIGLASGGGVVIKYASGNYGYNVHYDETEQKSGRSFGAGPTRMANDASDKDYLLDIQAYTEGDVENVHEFNRTLLQSLLNNDPSNYENVNEEGQTVLTDFLAVYTAEQARNLMDGRVHIHWDAALLEVTLLAGFHAGQKTLKMYYYNPKTKKTTWTSTVMQQERCALPTKSRPAEMRDYWQFSRRIDDPKNCGRSGINITKNEFRRLGKDITTYMANNYPDLLDAVKKSMGLRGRVDNIYLALSEFLINSKTPKKLSAAKVNAITEAWVEFLDQVTESADDIN